MDRSSQDLIIIVIAGTASILFLATLLIVYIFFYQKRQNTFIEEKEELQTNFENVLKETRVEVQENTMAHLARELHDNIGQLLSSAKILVGISHKNQEKVPPTLLAAEETIAKAISELRAISKSLSKEWLHQFKLIDNLKTEINRINVNNYFNISLTSPNDLPLANEKQIILFRIIQEAIQNSLKHANAHFIEVLITKDEKNITTIVKDDGKGFDCENMKTGLGLYNMKQRTHLLKGIINWTSQPQKGCIIKIEIPINNDNL